MVSVTASEGKYERYIIRIKHHAKTLEACAAVSAITVALQGWVEAMVQPPDRYIDIHDGAAVIWWIGSREPYDMALIGLESISRAYPDQITVKEDT